MVSNEWLPRTADVVIVGAGVMGLSIAFHLARAGVRDVVVLEQVSSGYGASGKTSGMIRQHYSHPTLVRWARRAVDIFPRFSEIYGFDAGFQHAPYLMLAGSEDQRAMEANVALQRAEGVDTRLVDTGEIERLVPGIFVEDLAIGCYEALAGFCFSKKAIAAYEAAAAAAGAQVVNHCQVRTVQLSEDQVVGVQTSLGRVAAPAVVVAAGSGVPTLLEPLGVHLPIRNLLHVGVWLQFAGPMPSEGMMISDRLTGIYSRPLGRGLTGVGATDVNEGIWDVPSWDFHDGADRATIATFASRLSHRFPRISTPKPVLNQAGTYHMTPDGQPILGAVGVIQGLYVAGGFSHGFKLSPVIGELMAKGITEGFDKVPEVRPFHPDRFERGELVPTMHAYVKAYAG